MTRKALLYVTTNAAEGREDDFNTWYDEVHVPEILEHVDGIHAATRYKRADASPGAADQPGYCAVYEIEADDPAVAVGNLMAAAGGGKLHMTDAISPGGGMFLWEEHTPRASRS
jgi:hypothetical protein